MIQLAVELLYVRNDKLGHMPKVDKYVSIARRLRRTMDNVWCYVWERLKNCFYSYLCCAK